MADNENGYVLLKLIVQRKQGERVLQCALKSGAPGVTYYYAQGSGVREKLGILAKLIEAEKMIIEVVDRQDRAELLLDQIIKETSINLPGKGFCYITPVSRVEGFMGGR
ncbi:MAG: P-II family nitrogen regulator [Elusimicrobiaceae bacterium]|nr:P-II family nitrogen regulator [Elusimicrobiaceae bacterium]